MLSRLPAALICAVMAVAPLVAIAAGWKVGVCVKEGLAASYKPTCVTPAATPAADEQTDENDDYLKLLKERLKKQ